MNNNPEPNKTKGTDPRDYRELYECIRELYERMARVEAQLGNMPTKSDLHIEIAKAIEGVEARVNKRWYQFVTWGLTMAVGLALYFRPF